MSATLALPDVAARVVATIHAHRIDLSNEKLAQEQIGEALRSAGLHFEREYAVSAADRPDFYLPPSGLVIEVKVRGARKADVFRQLRRYAGHDVVCGLLLATSASMGLPEDIEGKPTWYASLGRGWL